MYKPTVNGVTHEYILDGSNILCEKWGNTTLTPLYNINQEVCGILLNDGVYYFVKNLQGDVIAITDSRGNTVARYSYDAWGKCTITEDGSGNNIASINPYRYRSYYYDSEIDMYYLQSRYYDANVGRFVNADDPEFATVNEDVLQNNLYAYCCNEPIDYTDPYGSWPKKYTYTASTKINCYAYVLGLSKWRNVPGWKNSDNVYSLYCKVYNDITKILKRKAKKLGTKPLNFDFFNYYLIAMRVGHKFTRAGFRDDYHFMVRHSNFSWSHKPGRLPSKKLGGIGYYNYPSLINWDLPMTTSIGTIVYHYNFYSSATYYIAIKKD